MNSPQWAVPLKIVDISSFYFANFPHKYLVEQSRMQQGKNTCVNGAHWNSHNVSTLPNFHEKAPSFSGDIKNFCPGRKMHTYTLPPLINGEVSSYNSLGLKTWVGIFQVEFSGWEISGREFSTGEFDRWVFSGRNFPGGIFLEPISQDMSFESFYLFIY